MKTNNEITGSLVDDFGKTLMSILSKNFTLERYLHINKIDEKKLQVDLTFDAKNFLENHLQLHLEKNNYKLEINKIIIK